MIYVSLKQISAETPHTSRQVWSAGPSPSWPVLMLALSSPSLFRLWSLSWCPKSHSNNFSGQEGVYPQLAQHSTEFVSGSASAEFSGSSWMTCKKIRELMLFNDKYGRYDRPPR